MPKALTHEEYEKRFYDSMSNEYQLMNKYINAKTKVSILHKPCNTTYDTFPSAPLKGHGCGKCKKAIQGQKQRRTHEQFLKEVNELFGDEYKILSEYVTARIKVKILHTLCEKTFESTPDGFLSKKSKCKCLKETKARKTHEQFLEEVYSLVSNEYTVIGKYEKASVKLKMRHNVCNNVYEVSPNNFLRNCRCPECMIEVSAQKLRRSLDDYIKEVEKLTEGKYLVTGEYINARTKIEMYHVECDTKFLIPPDQFINVGTRCPNCNEKTSGEDLIKEQLTEYGINYNCQYRFNDCKYRNTLPFDFSVSDKQNKLLLLIEYDGQQHFHPVDFAGNGEEWAKAQFEETKVRDSIKNEYCIKNDIPLLRIPYWEFDNIKSILSQVIILNPLKINSKNNKYIVDKNWNQDNYRKGRGV